MNDQGSFPAGVSPAHGRGAVPSLPARLLVDLPNWLGDLVMALPATDRLIKANREGFTILHVRTSAAHLVSEIFPETHVVASERGENPLRTIRRFRKLGVRADIGVTMRNASRAKLLLRFASRWSAGTASQGGRSLLSWAYRPEFRCHQLHDADALLTRLGLDEADEGWRAPLSGSLVEWGRRELETAGVDPSASLVGLALGVACGGSAKRWPEEKFGRLAVLLKDRGLEPVVVIGPGEAKIAEAVIQHAGIDLPVVAENLDVAGLGAVLSGLSVLVGNDSGPAHLASALGIRTVALFGPTNDRRTAPMSPEGIVVRQPLECAPCGDVKCSETHQACLRDLDPQMVCDAVVERLTPDVVRLAGA